MLSDCCTQFFICFFDLHTREEEGDDGIQSKRNHQIHDLQHIDAGIRLNGQGVAEIFQNGKYIRGSWARDCSATKNLKNRMVFFDENGEELPMKVGKTFIQIVNNDQSVIVNAGEQIDGAAAQATPAPTATPKPTRTPKASANATPAPVEGESNADEDVSFGG